MFLHLSVAKKVFFLGYFKSAITTEKNKKKQKLLIAKCSLVNVQLQLG